ncbi:hypothetical protein OG250_15125 [Streptomyces sp. NBC_00487]|uniref:hypothetical protein n=1 Tax=unclassified Streptomyces TaxID=2593676 RepID=UPI002E18873F|nr:MULTISPECIES: hypothetical protein [unclassified Streptomyces]
MGFGTDARGVRDERLPLARRHRALRGAVGQYCPLGFNATWAYLAATACPAPDLRRDPAALLRALDTLEESRAAHLAEVDAFTARRHLEKAAGRRTPRASDAAALRGPRWPSSTAPSRPGLVAAVANRHAAFRAFPFPDETLSSDPRVRRLADLHARLDAAASAYLEDLGRLDRLDRPATEELADTVHGISSLTRPGYAPLNVHLLPWLRFARLLAYAYAYADAYTDTDTDTDTYAASGWPGGTTTWATLKPGVRGISGHPPPARTPPASVPVPPGPGP